MVRQSIEKRGSQLPVAEDTLLLSEGEVGGGDDLCTLVDQAFLGRGIVASIGDNANFWANRANLCANDVQNYERKFAILFNEIN